MLCAVCHCYPCSMSHSMHHVPYSTCHLHSSLVGNTQNLEPKCLGDLFSCQLDVLKCPTGLCRFIKQVYVDAMFQHSVYSYPQPLSASHPPVMVSLLTVGMVQVTTCIILWYRVFQSILQYVRVTPTIMYGAKYMCTLTQALMCIYVSTF